MSQRMCMRSGGHPLAACLLRWQTNGAARADQASLCRAARSWAPYASALRARDVCTGAPAPQRRYSGTTWPCSSAPRRLRTRTATLAPPPPRASPSARPASAPGEWRTERRTGRSDCTTKLTRHGYGTANTSAAHELSSTPAALRGHGQTIRPRRSVRGERQGAVRLQKRHTVHCARDERLPVHHLRTRHEV